MAESFTITVPAGTSTYFDRSTGESFETPLQRTFTCSPTAELDFASDAQACAAKLNEASPNRYSVKASGWIFVDYTLVDNTAPVASASASRIIPYAGPNKPMM